MFGIHNPVGQVLNCTAASKKIVKMGSV